MVKTLGGSNLPDVIVGDRRLGCMCGYAMLAPDRHKRKNPSPPLGATELANVDVYESSARTTSRRYFCHRGLTGAFPVATDSLHAEQDSRRQSVAMRTFATLRRALSDFIKFIFPKFQFGIGVSLFRFNQ